MNRLERWLTGKVVEMGKSPKDLSYRFRYKGKRYYIPPFNPLWCLIAMIQLTVYFVGICLLIIYTVLLAP